jgi:putative flavoprotein involved in K+ transport
VRRGPQERAHEARLADARLARDEHDAARAPRRAVQRAFEDFALTVAFERHENNLGGRTSGMGSSRRCRSSSRFLAFEQTRTEEDTVRTHRNTVVIGAGQAGLAASWWLVSRGIDHVVLERGRVAEKWRSQRWDSFTLLSPNWQTRLPGHAYSGPDPEGFMTGAETAAFLADYARSFAAPVVSDVTVTRVQPGGDGWVLETSAGPLTACNVIIATGELATPHVPAVELPVPALHTSDYRNPDGLPPGAVLVVGAGPSGQQIARELAAAGRRVHLAVGGHKTLPRRYRGHDTYWWMDRLGMLSRSVDTLPGGRPPRRSRNAVLAGGTQDLDVPTLAAQGVVVHGRFLDVRDGCWARFGDDLAATLAAADANADRFRATVDAYVATHRYPVPVEPARSRGPVAEGPRELDLGSIAAVIWATGFRRDYSWLSAPVLDAAGEPEHEHGITAAPGLYFLGLRWQSRRSSSFLDGVAADAEHVTAHLAARTSFATAA